MSNEELQNKIIENVKDKIAIYELEKENRNDKFSMKKFRNVAAVAVLTIGLSIGTAYGANIIYEKIWKEPTKIVGGGQTEEITEESIKGNITEDEAREIAKNKLNKIGIDGGELSKTRNYKDSYSEGIEYIFTTDDGKWEITINGMSKEFESLKSCEYNKNYEKYTMTRDEAIEVAKQYYEQFGYKEGEYESLLVTLGKGKGDNWWCILFPPLCSLEVEENNSENIEYSLYIKEMFEKYLK